ncbi:hypothetical protein ACKUFS_00445 [Pseudomonas cannabina]|uniref:Uncharacterized protein n=3 Tax=Pseudomonas syringae group TaxID=136849 RepID=A0A3M3RHC3_PSECA|nr:MULTISPECIES: hypothetical protein [Pseudomonas syringae group]KPB74927.1 Uncharacterized protein AC507_0010 [Pseudomonas syringae pv. maculicola]KPW19739.1 hypothetical protein ALO83_101246 [Pseudomonas cannabina pv. alisalensis]MBM0140499.1 hypothetical protein [Pseudomonas cannabina pv. alisalensis]QHE96006.1 hypothetical protein PMA4326_004845 [Pseudomonas syringae pv. maculicola str. ES4326]QQN23023.1 hypothetical protein JGS08_04930 [Pseudomonas cannabina pv. alisalensis]
MSLYADHAALCGLNTEQLAELALYGLRYRALGATDIDSSKPDILEPYWTGERLVKRAVKIAVKASTSGCPLARQRDGEAIGHLSALFNCGVIDNAIYMEQFKRMNKTKPS